MIRKSVQELGRVGYDTAIMAAVVKCDLPEGTRGLTCGLDTVVLSEEALESQEMTTFVMEEEYLHLLQKSTGEAAVFGPGTARELEEKIDVIRKFRPPEP